jgi:ABC-type nitrate/sulfonate/bicarbonate transport system substrate-binding protein
MTIRAAADGGTLKRGIIRMGGSRQFVLVATLFLAIGAFFYFTQGPELAVTATPPATDLTTIRYGINDAKNINRLPHIIAEREGFFAREGIRLETVAFTSSFREPIAGQNSGTIREAMDDGSINMSRQQLPLQIHDALTGGVNTRFVAVALVAKNPVYYLAVSPEIATYDDLRGRTVAVTNLHDGITIWVQELMAQNGLQEGDFELRIIAGSAARTECLLSGECDGAILAQPAIFDALDAGNHSLGITNEIDQLQIMVDIANPAWAEANRDLLVRYNRALAAAMDYTMDPMNREDVVRVTMEFMEESETRSRDMLTQIWNPENRVLPETPAIDMMEVTEAIALLGKYGALGETWPSAEEFVDPSYALAASQ